ncbi:MAG TPA: TIR domain-containing protein [Nitrososphaera sp.]|jgi:predicted nucleotide-binding protein|nr:TIR domain-containing protein [Nitrososphaera sp.]
MSNISDELIEIAEELDSLRVKFDSAKVKAPLDKLENAASKVGKSWSGSWLGYHSRVYYKNFQSPPPGARFSQEWGLMRVSFIDDTIGDWAEYDYDDVRQAIYDIARNPDLKPAEELVEKARNIIEDKRAEIVSLITTALSEREDSFLVKLKKEAEGAVVPNVRDFVRLYRPSGQFISRDMPAVGQGLLTPPHIAVVAEVMANRAPAKVCEALSKTAKQAGSHLAKRERYSRRKQEMGTKVFIGHGRSTLWKDLKDFIQDRLGLPWDEFNRVPVAGITNIARLSQMLDEAAIGFLILTAEDEQADGKLQARMNVIHEAGLFQGRLGFTRAILLLEEGCEEFSNIQGLGQIRFPKGNIRAIFEDVRQVLEREGLV